jgi:hypothetical protein
MKAITKILTKSLIILFVVTVVVSLSATSSAQMVKPSVIRSQVLLNLQSAEMHVKSAGGALENATNTSMKFAIDIKAKSEIFQTAFTIDGQTTSIQFAVVESTTDSCGVRTLVAAPTKQLEHKYLLTVVHTPSECSSGFVPEPIWAAQIVRSLGDTEMIDGHLDIFGTPAVVE